MIDQVSHPCRTKKYHVVRLALFPTYINTMFKHNVKYRSAYY
jgi:hypothetical protein